MRHKTGYFRFLGVVELLGFIGLLIYWIGYWARNRVDTFTGIIILIVIIVFGPAMGILFFSHADALDDLNEIYKEKSVSKQFAIGEKIVFNKDVVISDTDKRIIKQNSIGSISSISGAYATISVEFNGETIITKQLITSISKFENN